MYINMLSQKFNVSEINCFFIDLFLVAKYIANFISIMQIIETDKYVYTYITFAVHVLDWTVKDKV